MTAFRAQRTPECPSPVDNEGRLLAVLRRCHPQLARPKTAIEREQIDPLLAKLDDDPQRPLMADCGSSKMFARITSTGLVTAVLTNCQQICRAPLLGTLPGVSRRTELFALVSRRIPFSPAISLLEQHMHTVISSVAWAPSPCPKLIPLRPVLRRRPDRVTLATL